MLSFEKKTKKVQVGLRLEEEVWNKIREIKEKHVGYSLETIVNDILKDFLKNYKD